MQANNIATVRKFRGLTQEQAAEMLGVSIGTYRNWEQGKNNPGRSSLLKLRDLYRATADQLLIPGCPLPGQTAIATEDNLSIEETELVENYRICASEAKETLLTLSRPLAEGAQD